jgi:hypothetical protein
MRIHVAVVLLVSTACVPEEGPLMAPGQDCIACHGQGGAKAWTVAGTWRRGAHVTVTDASGKTVEMTGNKVGNFYTAEPLTFPIRVSVDGVEMPPASLRANRILYGGCNLCHVKDAGVRPMEYMGTGRDCLRCHDGNMAPHFYAAGTFPPAGRTVVIRDGIGFTVTSRTNAVGNFWVVTPLALPLQAASVDGASMPPSEGLGPGCNACHGSGEDND